MTIICNICGSRGVRTGIARHQQTNTCKTKPHPNDKFIVVDGRTYSKGKSPFEGVWHDIHVPYDIHEVYKTKPISN